MFDLNVISGRSSLKIMYYIQIIHSQNYSYYCDHRPRNSQNDK